MPRALTLVLAACLPFLGGAAETRETPADMLKLARPRVVAADFVQTRRLGELDMDIRITGSMVSELDGRLRWQVDSPVRSVTLIDREKLTHFDGETKQLAVIRQETFPWLKVLRDSLDDWLSGDPERLEKRFFLTVIEFFDKVHAIFRVAVHVKIVRSVKLESVFYDFEHLHILAENQHSASAGDYFIAKFTHSGYFTRKLGVKDPFRSKRGMVCGKSKL